MTLDKRSFGKHMHLCMSNYKLIIRTLCIRGCTSFTRLSMVLDLVNLKARFGWSDKSFNELLVVLKKMLPGNNTLPKNWYEAKKILCLVGMEHQKIHACPNDYILYRNQFADMCKCPTCGVSQYKVKDGEGSQHATTNNDRPTKV